MKLLKMSSTAAFSSPSDLPRSLRPDRAIYSLRTSLVPSNIVKNAAVAGDLLIGRVAHVAAAGGYLQCLVGASLQGFAGKDLAHRRFHRIILIPGIDVMGDHPHDAFGGKTIDRHLRDFFADEAEIRNGSAELLAHLC